MNESSLDPLKPAQNKEIGDANMVQKTAKKVYDYLNTSFFVYFSNSVLMDVVMPAFMNLNFLEFSSVNQILHHTVSVILIACYFYLIYKLLSIMISLELRKKDKIDSVHINSKFKNWLFLRIHIKESSSLLPRFVPETYLIHDFLLCLFLVNFHSNAKVQILSLMIMKIYQFLNLCQFPMKEALDQIMLLVNEFFFTCVLAFFLYLSGKEESEVDFEKVGTIIIGIYIVFLVFNCLIGFCSVWGMIKESCKSKKLEKVSKSGGLSNVI